MYPSNNNPYGSPYGSPYGAPGANPYAYPGAGAAGLDFAAVMRQAYLWLAGGLVICFGVAYAVGQAANSAIHNGQVSGLGALIFNPVALIVAFVVYLGLGFGFYPIVRRANPALGGVLYAVFAVVFGFLVSGIFVEYTTASIATTFLITAAMFGVMSVVGYVTRLDLSKLWAVFLVALIGLIIASIVNIFLASPILYWVITFAGVLIFTGLIAYDTQWLKRNAMSITAYSSGNTDAVARVALIGAFRLLLDFVNLFLFLLRIFGNSRN